MKIGKTLIAIPPGYTIKEQLKDRGITQKEFSLRMEMSQKHISKLINGEVLLTTDMAIRLEMVLGLSATFWLNLESSYREKLAKIEVEEKMEEEIILADQFPYSELVELGWIPNANSKNEKVVNLRKYFEVNRLGLLFENKHLSILYRRLNKSQKADFALMAWAQKAKLEARKRVVSSININGLKRCIKKFRKLTTVDSKVFCGELVDILAKNGVALILLPHISGSFLHGATFYDGNKIVMGLTVRGKDADKFWFSFFHELGHIILGHIDCEYSKQMELEADDFARDNLIPLEEFNKFVLTSNYTENEIVRFANKIDIDCGIVVGRLQKEGYIPYTQFNDLKTKYDISN